MIYFIFCSYLVSVGIGWKIPIPILTDTDTKNFNRYLPIPILRPISRLYASSYHAGTPGNLLQSYACSKPVISNNYCTTQTLSSHNTCSFPNYVHTSYGANNSAGSKQRQSSTRSKTDQMATDCTKPFLFHGCNTNVNTYTSWLVHEWSINLVYIPSFMVHAVQGF